MQTAETILNVIHERGRRGLPLERIYRQLFNRELYLLAYGRIYSNKGAMTPGATAETVDGMSQAKIETIIEQLRYERFRWTPVRRSYVEKKNSTKKRPLGVPTWSNKLLQEVIRLILEAYYEPQFSQYSHGFRPKRGCHTALREIYDTWTGTAWFIEGDIRACFDSLDHDILLSIISKDIHDNRFIQLVSNLLKAGYLEDWKYNVTLSGCPQGSIVSPVLSNIYLHRLDKYVKEVLLPKYNRGKRRKYNPVYNNLISNHRYHVKQGHKEKAAKLRKQLHAMPSVDSNDPDYRRLRYIRYADDWLLGFCGPRNEAEEIKQELGQYLRETLKLELSEAKTLITHARTETARFLGYEIETIQEDQLRNKKGHRTINGKIGLKVPRDVIKDKMKRYMRNGKAIHLAIRLHHTDFSIVEKYQQEYRGLVEYYRFAYNLHQFNHLRYIMEQSLTKTLAHKLKISVPKVYKRYKAVLETPNGSRKGLKVVIEREGKKPLIATWGGISLKWRVDGVLDDNPPIVWNQRTEIVERLLADRCELCGATGNCEVHHIRALKDLKRKGRSEKPLWVQIMAARQRKTLVVCKSCHYDIHAGRIDK